MAKEDVIYSSEMRVKCEGEGEKIGHPLVYLDLHASGEVVCPYCSQRFKYQKADQKG